jgi:hypothetical protein
MEEIAMSKKNKDSELDEKDIIAQEADEELGYVLSDELKPHERKDNE